jgi:type 1 glutamine amidotransferase
MSSKRLRIGAAGLGLALLACLAVSVGITRAQQQPQQDAPSGAAPRRVKVLWLGDDGHHVPLARARQVYADFARRGIDFTYTDRMEDLNPQNLARYDALMVYANVERIAPEQEQAILDYVAAGHGYVPVHCGSFCFLNSPKLTALTGARFQRHGTGTFTETIAQADHPIEKGLNPITSWDETYVHNMHNDANREVLGYRVEGDHREPYTWTRTEGKGRVFYTAWGHDERTWGNRDFQNLLERGLRWAAGDWALAPQPKFKPFEYTEANLPNYVQGARWGVTGEPIRTMQQPVSPEESMKHMVVPPGTALSLEAAEPDVKKPNALAFD